MPLAAILLLIISAALHTTWNLLLKQSEEKTLATWWAVVIGGGLSLLALPFTGLPAYEMRPYVVVSAALEVVYFIMLSQAYAGHDFSVVYPVARGGAPAFLLLGSALFLQEQNTPAGLAGLVLIVGGLFIIGSSNFPRDHTYTTAFKGLGSALFIALLISAYTLIDGTAVKQGAMLPYALLVFVLIPLPATPLIVWRYGWREIMNVWKTESIRLALIGLLGVAAYLFALAAYTFAPLAYAGAIREVSVVLGALAGWIFLGERMGMVRLIGALVVFGGIVVIAFLG